MSDALNIAVVGACPYPAPQGSQVYLRNTALAWRHAGHNVRLVTYGYGIGEANELLPLNRSANIPGAHRTAAGPSFAKPMQDALLASTLARVRRDHRIDIIDAHNYEALAIALAIGARPIIYHAHNALADELPHYTSLRGIATTAGRAFDRTLPRRADLVIAPHDRLRDYLLEVGCRPDRVHTIPPPIEIEIAANRKAISSPIDLLYAGNLDSYQNPVQLEHVVQRLRQSRPKLRLIVATNDARNDRLLHVSRFATIVRGSIADALENGHPAIFVTARTSWSGYPIKLLNAMAAALPIVCFQSAGPGLTHEHDALLVPDGDVDAFADAVTRMLDDPAIRARLGAAARRTVELRHSIPAAAAMLNTLAATLSRAAR